MESSALISIRFSLPLTEKYTIGTSGFYFSVEVKVNKTIQDGKRSRSLVYFGGRGDYK
jgi:hypothetical protein